MPGEQAPDRPQDKAVTVARVPALRARADGHHWTRLIVVFLRGLQSRRPKHLPDASVRDRKPDKAAPPVNVALARVTAVGHGFSARVVPFLRVLPSRLAERVPRARRSDKVVGTGQGALARAESDHHLWTGRLVVFLRIVAVLAILTGLYHWAQVTGFVGGEEDAFENQPTAWQAATVYFAVIDLVAGVGLWLATPWGAVVWLSSVVSMAVIELMFPGIYGGSLLVVAGQAAMLVAYLALAFMAARERQP